MEIGGIPVKVSGSGIRRLRERQGWFQADLASRAGLSRSYIANVEAGDREPSPLALSAIAKALDVDPHTLIESEIVCPHCGHRFLL